MSFASLASNQAVSEADAATGEFTLQSGQSHGSSNQCMSKDAANTKYVLDTTIQSSYAGNQLLPKSGWLATNLCLSPAYTTVNGLGGDASTFATARSVGTVSDVNSFVIGASQSGINFFQVRRAFFGFNTSTITNASGIDFKFTLNQPATTTGMSLVLVRPTTNFPANHAWVLADFPSANGGTLMSNVVPIAQSQTGVVTFTLNATGVAYVNGTNDANFVILQYENDYLNVSPTVVGAPYVAGNNVDIRLCPNGTAPPVTSYSYLVSFNGFANHLDSCNEQNIDYQTLYSSSNVISIGMLFYTTSTLTNGTQFNGGGLYYRADAIGGAVIKIDTAGQVIEMPACSPTAYSFELAGFFLDATTACQDFQHLYTIYAPTPTVGVGSTVYGDNSLETPFNGQDFFWHDINANITYEITSVGYILTVTDCSEFNANVAFQGSAAGACALTHDTIVYTNGSEYFYDIEMQNPITSGSNWWKFEGMALRTTTGGASTSAQPCG